MTFKIQRYLRSTKFALQAIDELSDLWMIAYWTWDQGWRMHTVRFESQVQLYAKPACQCTNPQSYNIVSNLLSNAAQRFATMESRKVKTKWGKTTVWWAIFKSRIQLHFNAQACFFTLPEWWWTSLMLPLGCYETLIVTELSMTLTLI